MHDLDGRTAVITGASRGIGAATAVELAACGVRVVLAARSLAASESLVEEIGAAGGTALAVACDVARYDQVAEAITRCNTVFGSVDILVNNAGVIEPVARLHESDPNRWSDCLDINLKGVYHGLRAAIPPMLAQGGGAIVNLSSGAATSALEGWSHYCASKAGVLSLTRCADREYRAHGLQVIGLSPGTVATDMQVSIRASGINPVSQLDPSVHIAPQRVARAIAWLCTAEAAEFRGSDFSLKSEANRRLAGIE